MKKNFSPLARLLATLLIVILASGSAFASASKKTYRLTVLNKSPSLGKVYAKSGSVKSGNSVTIKAKPGKKYFATLVMDGKVVKTSRTGKSVKYKLRMREDHAVKIYFTATGKKFVMPPSPVSLGWSVPEYRENGDQLSLSEIRGYRIHYATADKKISRTIAINDARIVSALVEVPKAGTYYFSIATVEMDGDSSQMSNPVKIVIH